MGRISGAKLKWFLLAGIAVASLLAPLAMNSSDKPFPAGVRVTRGVEVKDNDHTRAKFERLKDKNKYYSSPTLEKLVAMAHRGDMWAMREIAWPEGHDFHWAGRPFFRNNGPHPDGLKFYSGFVED